MKYKITLNEKTYEVEVEKGEAIVAAEYEAAAPAAAPAAPAAAPVAPAAAPAAPAAAPAAPAAAPAVPANGEVISSPLPGVIVAVKVANGESVKRGQVLVIIEAMKMENEIVSPRDGVVGSISTAQGATVNSGAPLLTLA